MRSTREGRERVRDLAPGYLHTWKSGWRRGPSKRDWEGVGSEVGGERESSRGRVVICARCCWKLAQNEDTGHWIWQKLGPSKTFPRSISHSVAEKRMYILFIVSIFINQVLLYRHQRILLLRMIFQKWVLLWSQIFCFTANYHPLIFLRVAIHVAGIFLFLSFSYRTLIPLSNIPNYLVYLKSWNLFSNF